MSQLRLKRQRGGSNNDGSEEPISTVSSMGALTAISSVGNEGTSSPLHSTYAVSSFSDNYVFQSSVIVHPIFTETALDVS